MSIANSNQQDRVPETREQYLSPECEKFEFERDDIMKQTSYHYMGGPDD